MKEHELKPPVGSQRPRKRVGRGNGSGHGTYSGRGGKGQTARPGVRIKGFEGGQMPITRRVPKRGFTNPFREESQVIRLSDLERVNGEVTAESLAQAGLVDAGKKFKVLANGEVKKAVKVKGIRLSAGAREKIVAAGGSVEE